MLKSIFSWSCLISPKVQIEPGSPRKPYEHDTPAGTAGLWRYKIHVLTVQIYSLSQHSFVFHIVLSRIISTAQQERTLLTIRHTSSLALTFHSFSAVLLSPLQQLTQTTRDEIFHHALTVCENRVQWCQIHEVKHTHTQHMVDTLLYSSAKKPTATVFVCGLHIKHDTITVHDWFSISPFDITTLSFITQCYSVKVWLKQTGIQIRFGVVSWLKGLSSL